MRLLVFFLIIFISSSVLFGENDFSPNRERVESIFNRLYRTSGIKILEKPKLEISNENENVAAYYPRKNVIEIEQKALTVCESFGNEFESAVAFILGHELAHSLQKEGRVKDQATSYLAFDHVEDSGKRTEHNADMYGIFNAYLAGYKTIEILPDLIYRIYEAYDLIGKDLKRYPKLETTRS